MEDFFIVVKGVLYQVKDFIDILKLELVLIGEIYNLEYGWFQDYLVTSFERRLAGVK